MITLSCFFLEMSQSDVLQPSYSTIQSIISVISHSVLFHSSDWIKYGLDIYVGCLRKHKFIIKLTLRKNKDRGST